MKRSRLLRRRTRRKKTKRIRNTRRQQKPRSRVTRMRRTRARKSDPKMRRKRLVQRGGSGLAQALYNAAFVGSGPPFGVDPKSPAALSCPGGGCDAAHYCNTQANAGGSNKATPGMRLGTLCQNGAALLGQAEPPKGSPFAAMKKFKQDTSVP
jgi:hypothetical protein